MSEADARQPARTTVLSFSSPPIISLRILSHTFYSDYLKRTLHPRKSALADQMAPDIVPPSQASKNPTFLHDYISCHDRCRFWIDLSQLESALVIVGLPEQPAEPEAHHGRWSRHRVLVLPGCPICRYTAMLDAAEEGGNFSRVGEILELLRSFDGEGVKFARMMTAQEERVVLGEEGVQAYWDWLEEHEERYREDYERVREGRESMVRRLEEEEERAVRGESRTRSVEGEPC
ncbi:MAG: hypothetical protein LQ340_005901 [Diploschistes diacapsis]|nr:MAG: hypothetical protein LQ340_005901 [Diploschistes diacapsis]